MIVRVWGKINGTEVEFTKVKDRPDYYEGIGPKVPGDQDIEIWAERDNGVRAHLNFLVSIKDYAPDRIRLLLCPYRATLIKEGEYGCRY